MEQNKQELTQEDEETLKIFASLINGSKKGFQIFVTTPIGCVDSDIKKDNND